jgi:hypothetical protein
MSHRWENAMTRRALLAVAFAISVAGYAQAADTKYGDYISPNLVSSISASRWHLNQRGRAFSIGHRNRTHGGDGNRGRLDAESAISVRV